MLRQNGLRREDVFIANVVKHRPPNNRDPLPDEIEACASFLSHQIDAIDPLVIITLGRFSLARFFPGEKISQIHGKPRKIGGRTVIPLYHPAAALHQGALRKVLEADFAKVPGIVDIARRAAGRTAPPPAPPLPAEPVQQAFLLLQDSAEKQIGEGIESSTDLTGTAAPKPPRQLPLL
jgi:DNA polymerase